MFRIFITVSLFLFSSSTYSNQAYPNSSIQIGKTKIEISYEDKTPNLLLTNAQIVKWIELGAKATSDFYQGFPVTRLKIIIDTKRGSNIGGQAFSGYDPEIILQLGQGATQANIDRDWVLVHEMVHLALSRVYSRHHWLEEGLSTYIEPKIRVRAGLMDEKEAWYWMLTGMPKGLPGHADKGLDHTPTWGRTYWGGALFSLLADIRIREKTNNRYGLEDSLRAIVNAGFNMQNGSVQPIMKMINIGDEATKTKALLTIYNEMKDKPMDIDLEKIWKRYGVRREGKKIIFTSSASQAALRNILIKGEIGPT